MKIEKINNLFRQLANWILRHRLIVGALFAVVIGLFARWSQAHRDKNFVR